MALKNGKIWRVSILELLCHFRNAIKSVVPHISQAQVKWKTIEAYDDWDDIVSALYKAMVVNNILHSQEYISEKSFVPYDLIMPSYEDYNYLGVDLVNVNSNFVFLKFLCNEESFEKIIIQDLKSKKTQEVHIENCKIFLKINEKKFDQIHVVLE